MSRTAPAPCLLGPSSSFSPTRGSCLPVKAPWRTTPCIIPSWLLQGVPEEAGEHQVGHEADTRPVPFWTRSEGSTGIPTALKVLDAEVGTRKQRPWSSPRGGISTRRGPQAGQANSTLPQTREQALLLPLPAVPPSTLCHRGIAEFIRLQHGALVPPWLLLPTAITSCKKPSPRDGQQSLHVPASHSYPAPRIPRGLPVLLSPAMPSDKDVTAERLQKRSRMQSRFCSSLLCSG